VTRQTRLTVDPHPARPTNRRATRTTNPNRPIKTPPGLKNPLKHRAMRIKLNHMLIPIRRPTRLRIETTQTQLELSHVVSVYDRLRRTFY